MSKINRLSMVVGAAINLFIFSATTTAAHEPSARAAYLANEAIMVTSGETKIMFDPLFGEGFGIYHTVPAKTLGKIMKGEAPFDGVDAIFISHAHSDHFAAKDMIIYMQTHKNVHLLAPLQAIKMMRSLGPKDTSIFERCLSFDLSVGQPAQYIEIGNLSVGAVRIPHAGNRPTVQNIVFRVTLNDDITVMHMGDAAVDDKYFAPYAKHWTKRKTDRAFPPYWFFDSARGRSILRKRINAKSFTGVHVPIDVPFNLVQGNNDYFSRPGETRKVETEHKAGHNHE